MQKEDHRTRVAAQRRDRMRRRLFESAMQLVAKKGPAATSIDDVIQAAEVSRGTFYKYFDTTDALFDALALEVANEIIRMAEPEVVRLQDPAERVATGMRLTLQVALRNAEAAGFLVRLGWLEMRSDGVLLDYLQRDLRQGMREGRFLQIPMRLALNIVSMTVFGGIHAMLEVRARKGFAEQAVASALRALGLEHEEALRLVALELPAAHPVEDGLVGPASAPRAPAARKRAAG